MAKRIWIVNYYTASPEKMSNPRYLEFAQYFMLAGYEVVIFNSNISEGVDFKEKFIDKWYSQYHFIHVKSPKYQGNGLKRMWSIFCFSMRLFFNRRKFERPNVVLHNTHIPFDYPVYYIAKRFRAKYITESWDMWPQDFVTFGLLSAKNPAMKWAYRMERKLYERADEIVFTMEGGLDYLKSRSLTTDTGGRINPDKVHYINNGINLEQFELDKKKYGRTDAELNDPSIYKVIYMGSIRLVNHVKELIDAAAILQNNKKYCFLIYGDGDERQALEKYVYDNKITNVIFKEKRIPLREVAWIVSQATVNVMNYQKGFGLHGVSSGKMFQYFAAGKPICCNTKLAYSEISRNNLGIDRDLDTPEQYAEAIRELAEQPHEDYERMCFRVLETAKRFDYKVLSAKELAVIES